MEHSEGTSENQVYSTKCLKKWTDSSPGSSRAKRATRTKRSK